MSVFTRNRQNSYGKSRRVVRLMLEALEDRLVPASFPDPGLQWNGGPLLSHVEITPVFYGQSYYTAAGFSLVDTPAQAEVGKDTQFLQFLVNNSSYIDLLGEYSVTPPTPSPPPPPPGVLGHIIGVVRNIVSSPPVPSAPILIEKGSVDPAIIAADANAPANGTQVTDAQIQKLIGQEVQSGNIKPDANALVVVFLPQGVSIPESNGTIITGYHGATASGNIPYAVITYPPNMSENQAFNQITYTTSQEVAEAVTDPQPGSGWNAANPQVVDPSLHNTSTSVAGEVGQLVENNPASACVLDGYTVTGLFSLQQYNATGNGLKYPDGAIAAGSGLALSNAAFSASATSYPLVTSSSYVPLSNSDYLLQVSSTANSDGSVSGTFSGQYDPSSTATASTYGYFTISDQQGTGLYTLSYGVDVSTGQVSGSFDITPAGVALGYGPLNAPFVSTTTGLTATSTNNAGTDPTFSGILATFSDSGQGFSAAINWGDGTITPGTIVADPSLPGQYEVEGTYTFAAGSVDTTHAVSVTIADSAGGNSTFQTTITNAVAPLSWTTGSIQVSVGKAVTNAAVGTFVDPAGADPTLSYTATIDWGDGSAPSQGTVTYDGQKFTVQGSHTYTQYGIYTLSISVQDADGSQANFASTATVTPIPTTTVLNASPFSSTAGQPLTLIASVQTTGPGVPTGSVTFLDGQSVLGSANLDATGKATFIATSLSPGQHSITATYSGDNIFQDGISSAITLTVSASPSGGGGGVQLPPPWTPPALNVPPLLAFFDSFLGGIETVNYGNRTETIVDSFFGFPLLVSTFNSSGNLVSVTLFGFNVTFIFG